MFGGSANAKTNLKNLTFGEQSSLIKKLGEPAFRARQISKWLYVKRCCDIEKMTNLSKSLRDKLSEKYCADGLVTVEKMKSEDRVIKYIFGLSDGLYAVETVYIPEEKRGTVCLSTQVGCRFACLFCATGRQGFKRNLTLGEILNQIVEVQNDPEAGTVTHVVIMGMGEPLDNFDVVVEALTIMNSKDGFGIGKRRITLSTVGLAPEIRRLGELDLDVNLAVSLHSADDEIRSRLLSVNKKYPVSELMKACREFPLKPQRKITMEIVLFDGVNDSPTDAKKLIKALHGVRAKVNLIRLNRVESCSLIPSPADKMADFKERLLTARIPVTIRKSRGGDIRAACGQLGKTPPTPVKIP
ncbi:MAG: dual-specificity RNA methyltransferase RlmN [bacterium]|nr:MAG: dual-specificity RNA methyltransferase RlmN [bacterium]